MFRPPFTQAKEAQNRISKGRRWILRGTIGKWELFVTVCSGTETVREVFLAFAGRKALLAERYIDGGSLDDGWAGAGHDEGWMGTLGIAIYCIFSVGRMLGS
jgi:hypothetical protein